MSADSLTAHLEARAARKAGKGSWRRSKPKSVKRSKGVKRRRTGRPRRELAWRSDGYRAAVRQLPCALAKLHPAFHFCPYDAAMHAHHHTGTGRGRGQKAGDDQCMPLCSFGHADLHGFHGFFKGMSGEDRAAWQDARVQETQRALNYQDWRTE